MIRVFLNYRDKEILFRSVSKKQFGLYKLYYNYNHKTIAFIKQKMLESDVRLRFWIDDLLWIKQITPVMLETIEDVFEFAAVDYFPPDSPLNV